MAGHFAKFLTDRQIKVVNHIASVVGFDIDEVEYYKSKEYLYELSSIDIAVFYPTENFNYYLFSTVGLSAYQYNPKMARAELFMILPPTWKLDMEKEEYNWPVEFLKDIAYNLVDSKMGVSPYAVYEMENSPYLKGTDTQGGIVVFPEMLPLEIIEEKIDDSYTRFFQLVSLNKAQLLKIKDVGTKAFVDYDLHDASGVANVVAKEPVVKKGTNIESIIEHNTKALKE